MASTTPASAVATGAAAAVATGYVSAGGAQAASVASAGALRQEAPTPVTVQHGEAPRAASAALAAAATQASAQASTQASRASVMDVSRMTWKQVASYVSKRIPAVKRFVESFPAIYESRALESFHERGERRGKPPRGAVHKDAGDDNMSFELLFAELGLTESQPQRWSSAEAKEDFFIAEVTVHDFRHAYVEVVNRVTSAFQKELQGRAAGAATSGEGDIQALQDRIEKSLVENRWAALSKGMLDFAEEHRITLRTIVPPERRTEFQKIRANWPHDPLVTGFPDPLEEFKEAGFKRGPTCEQRDRMVCRADKQCSAVYMNYQPWDDVKALRSLHDSTCEFFVSPDNDSSKAQGSLKSS